MHPAAYARLVTLLAADEKACPGTLARLGVAGPILADVEARMAMVGS
jgi:hypothetical protein